MRILARWLCFIQTLAACGCASNSVVNLSHYDRGRPDFGQMSRQGIKAAIHEATYPVAQIDDKYAQRQNEALQAGLLWGAYHFADATNPIRQADRFLNVVGSNWRSSPRTRASPGVLLVLDFEKNHYAGGTMQVDQAVEFIHRIHERTGKYPGLYSSEYRVRDVLNSPKVSASSKETLRRCWLWIANYHHRPRTTSPWSHWSLWQYTGDGICDLPRSSHPTGIANLRPAERNFFNGNPGAVRAFWERHAWKPR